MITYESEMAVNRHIHKINMTTVIELTKVGKQTMVAGAEKPIGSLSATMDDAHTANDVPSALTRRSIYDTYCNIKDIL